MNQASFSIRVNFLDVVFSDTSTVDNFPITAWAWNFGDTASNTSTIQNPSHTFSAPGKFKVTLTITYDTDKTITVIRYILVDTKIILPVTLEDLIKLKLPVIFPYQNEQLYAAISTWQLYIQPLINSPGVSPSDVFNEMAYPPIVNALIAYLVTYQIMTDYVSGSAMSSIGSGMGDSGGLIKKIETGPANAEFMDTSDYLKFIIGPNGLMSQIKSQMCMLASRSKINIPYCPPLPIPKFIPLKASIRSTYVRTTYVFNLWNINPSDVISAL